MNEKTPVSIKETTLDHLVSDDRNFNKGTEFGNAMIEKSLRKLGAGRSIVLDENNRIISGNKTVENAASVGLDKVIVVETTGDQIVAVKRVDIDRDSKKGRELALADNATSKANLDWDEGVISAVASEWDINTNEWGVDLPEAQVSAEDAEEDSYEIPDNIETDIQPGDAFELHVGPIKYRLICGDATSVEDVKLFAYQIGNSSKAGGIVVDPFAVSGTAMIVSTQMNRNCYAMELDPKYCQVIIDRMLKEYPECEVIELTK